jgi:hypothetical protein
MRSNYSYGEDETLIEVTDAATAVLTANLDTQDAHYATVRVALSSEANTNSTNVDIQLSESDDTVVTNFATFDADYNRTVDNTAGVVATNHIDLRGRKRYIRLTVTPDTTTNGAVGIAAISTLFRDVHGTVAPGEDVVVG